MNSTVLGTPPYKVFLDLRYKHALRISVTIYHLTYLLQTVTTVANDDAASNWMPNRTCGWIAKGDRMRKLSPIRWPRLWLNVTAAVILLSLVSIYVFMHVSKKPITPGVPVVSVCKELVPGMRRIGDRNGLQFDVPVRNFTVHEGWSDAAPFTHGFDLRPQNSESLLDISLGGRRLENAEADPRQVFSTHVEKRTIFNDKGRAIGKDDWGYLKSGERWRKVQFGGGDGAGYGFVNEKDAELFDQIINSACFLPSPGP